MAPTKSEWLHYNEYVYRETFFGPLWPGSKLALCEIWLESEDLSLMRKLSQTTSALSVMAKIRSEWLKYNEYVYRKTFSGPLRPGAQLALRDIWLESEDILLMRKLS